MSGGPAIRSAGPADFGAIAALLDEAFGGDGESRLVSALRADGDVVLELVATEGGEIVGHLLFSRLRVEDDAGGTEAVSLAPLSVTPGRQRGGIGAALVARGHEALRAQGERLSVVLGEPDYYGRFGYRAERAAGFGSDYAGPYLQALAWGEAPATGRLVYAPAFAAI